MACWVLVCALILPQVARAAEDADRTYTRIRDAYLALKADPRRQRYRDSYLPILDRFERFEAEHRTHPKADDALYNAGQLAWSLYRISRVRGDLHRAIRDFEALAERHPKSRLADDALTLVGQILVEHGGDKTDAYRHFAAVVRRYPQGDMQAEARRQMKALAAYRPKPETPKASPPPAPTTARRGTWRGTPSTRPVEVQEVKTWSNDTETRVVIYLSGPVRYREGEIPADPKKGLPRRYYIDVQPATLAPAARAPVPVGDGLLEKVRSGQFAPDVVRVVLDIQRMRRAHVFPMTHPDRVVIDVSGSARSTAPVATRPGAAPSPASLEALQAKVKKGLAIPLSVQAGLKIRRVVVDPGHGGKDTGAVGRGGLKEKDVTLAIAKKVARRLRKLGLEVILTREDDRFIPLEERTAIANTKGADLFLSIHANAHNRRDRRGLSTYFLDLSNDRYSVRLAALENATTERSVSDLRLILADLATRSNVAESSLLAQRVQKETLARLREDWKGVRDLGVKSALFYVLLGARMPAILVETSFISNPTEERRLASGAYRDALAEGIVAGVEAFLEHRRAIALGSAAR